MNYMTSNDFVHVEHTWSTPDAEKLIVKMARVSNPKNQDNFETAPKLIKYLISHKHWSPFEMANLCVQIQTQRDISAQILRHRSFSFQEYSSRYANVSAPAVPDFRRQDLKNRQNSIDDIDEIILKEMHAKTTDQFSSIYKLYEELLDSGVAKETARRILPLCSPTVLYMNGTLRSWIHYLELRCGNGTQYEHQLVANECAKIFNEKFPVISEALNSPTIGFIKGFHD